MDFYQVSIYGITSYNFKQLRHFWGIIYQSNVEKLFVSREDKLRFKIIGKSTLLQRKIKKSLVMGNDKSAPEC